MRRTRPRPNLLTQAFILILFAVALPGTAAAQESDPKAVELFNSYRQLLYDGRREGLTDLDVRVAFSESGVGKPLVTVRGRLLWKAPDRSKFKLEATSDPSGESALGEFADAEHLFIPSFPKRLAARVLTLKSKTEVEAVPRSDEARLQLISSRAVFSEKGLLERVVDRSGFRKDGITTTTNTHRQIGRSFLVTKSVYKGFDKVRFESTHDYAAVNGFTLLTRTDIKIFEGDSKKVQTTCAYSEHKVNSGIADDLFN